MDYKVTGMTCASCSARVEKVVKDIDGVTSCTVNLLTGSMKVAGDVDSTKVIDAVISAGYGARLEGEDKRVEKEEKSEVKPVLIRFLVSVLFLLPLMYVSMGHVMWGAPLPNFFETNPIAIGLVEFILSGIILVINQGFFIRGAKGIILRAPNMDTLVSLGSIAGFIYSTVVLFNMTALTVGGLSEAHLLLHDLYFEASGMILVLITLGKMLEAISKGRTTDALRGLMSLSPDTAVVLRDGKEQSIKVEEIRVGDIFIVKAGDKIAVDGTVIEGGGSVDEGALTGESIPVDKTVSDTVFQGTILSSGYIKCRADRVGEDTTLAKIIKTVTDASSTKAPISRLADKVSGIFVPVVIAISVVVFCIWLIIGESVGFALSRGISVLVISCPCALGLATPVAIMVASGKGAKCGVLFKSAESIENLGKVKVVVLDKTGTITEGVPEVSDVVGEDVIRLLTLAYSLELKSEHPLSRAIVSEGERRNLKPIQTTQFETVVGRGLQCYIEGKILRGGNLSYLSEICTIGEDVLKEAKRLSEEGKTPLYFGLEGEFLGIIAVSDRVKEDSKTAIKQLKDLGLKVVMLTGDNERTARAIAENVGIDEVHAGVFPDKKGDIVKAISEVNKVAMVGDGINDAPALTTADVGIAIGAGSDIAIDSASVVLVKNRLSDVVKAIKLSRGTLRVIKENLFWAFIYNTLGIPLAGGAFISLFGWSMSPMFGALAMSLSSVCVVTNALRINLFKLSNKENNDKQIKEEDGMKKVMKIEGIMCMHCEARVKKALEAIDTVTLAEVSHVTGEAIVTLNADTPDVVLKEAVEAQDYKVVEIK